MTTIVQIIKQKIHQLPPLSLPQPDLPFILQTYASDTCWDAILLQKHPRKEEFCASASSTFSYPQLKYPSSHKEILAAKKGIKCFRLFLNNVHFTVKIDLKHMKGKSSNKILLEQGHSIILRWALWLEGFDFDIVYKDIKENYLVDLLTKEGATSSKCFELKKFEIGESSSSRQKDFIDLCPCCTYAFCWDCFSSRIKALPLKFKR